jgi:hypothetical protein
MKDLRRWMMCDVKWMMESSPESINLLSWEFGVESGEFEGARKTEDG